MANIYEELKQRGFVYQCTDEESVAALLQQEPLTFYIGFDPTADSLHVGSLIPILAMVHLQRAGHRPIGLTGGGTAMVGDPSGKTEMRKILTVDSIRENAGHMSKQLQRFMVLDGDKGISLDNSDWLLDLNYVEFLREIGRHFSVNKMLSFESYKMRLETGLSFLEFNYMLLQSYDFLVLYREHGCVLQMGGQDQWGNIVAGADLVRREEAAQVYGLTFPLLLDASGEKFGKSVAGATWLSAERTSLFDFYQFWRNLDDADVARLLKLFTFLPVEECERLGALQPPLINRAKEILGYEVTRFVHGDEAAAGAYLAACKHFPSADPDGRVPTTSSIANLKIAAKADVPTYELPTAKAGKGIGLLALLVQSGLCSSKGEARRLIRQGGARLAGEQIKDENFVVTAAQLGESPVVKAGKKRMVKVVLA